MSSYDDFAVAFSSLNLAYAALLRDTDALRNAVDNVLKLHKEEEGWCTYCEDDYPCRTIRVLTGKEVIAEEPNPSNPEIDEVIASQFRTTPSLQSTGKFCELCTCLIYEGQKWNASVVKVGQPTRYEHDNLDGCNWSMNRARQHKTGFIKKNKKYSPEYNYYGRKERHGK